MSANFTMSSPSFPLGRSSAVLLVYRYNVNEPDLVLGRQRKHYSRWKILSGTGLKYELLPFIRCLSITVTDGSSPGSARFRYAFGDPLGNPKDPQRLEQVYPLNALGRKVIKTDDRIVVKQLSDDGTYTRLLFDGFVQLPQGDLAPDTESVTFEAVATPIRAFDAPLFGAVYRDGNDQTVISDAATDLPIRFNPDGSPNAVLDANRSGSDPYKYSVFFDPLIVRSPDVRALWSLRRAVQYCQEFGNPDETFVQQFSATTLDKILVSIDPKVDGQPININDSTTYTATDIIVPDVDVTGDPWPVAIEKLITPHGFGVKWDLLESATGDPDWRFIIYDKNVINPVKSLYLQQSGNQYDPNGTNIGSMSLNRDRHHMYNQISVDTQPIRYECSFVLAPGFTPASADASIANRVKFSENSPSFPSNRDAYRLFVFDETGEGHWDFDSSTFVTSPIGSLYDLLGDPITSPDGSSGPIPQFVYRRRKPIGTLFSKDATGKQLKAELWVSVNYQDHAPGIWKKGSETWQKITEGGWELLPDRLGIKITVTDPWNWVIADPKSDLSSAPFPKGVINIIQSLASSDTANPYFDLRLTCVIESDVGLNADADKRASSPTQFTIERREDTRDRFAKHVISQYAATNTTSKDIIDRDDTTNATDYAEARRRAHEVMPFTGNVTIPRITKAYAIGDHIDQITGRNVSLRTNAGTEQGEGPTYPAVASITWNFDDNQSTTLNMTDRIADPARRRTK